MATLKEHQAAMVDLLANGSGIPASASRLAHAMHDVLKFMTTEQLVEHADWRCLDDATTPGLNDKALAGDLEACRPKATRFNMDIKLADMDEVKMTLQNMQSHLDGARDSQRAAERRVKELENTVKQLRGVSRASRDERIKELENTVNQLRAGNAKLRQEKAEALKHLEAYLCGPGHELDCVSPEQAGCPKPDTQVCDHIWVTDPDNGLNFCAKCGWQKQ